MSDYNFDIQEGKLLVGAAAVENAVEAGVNPADIQTLSSLLLNNTVNLVPTSYPKVECDSWSKDDYRTYAAWLRIVINQDEISPRAPTENAYQRAYYLGIGPTPKRITNRFGALWKFHDEMGYEGGYCRGKYDNWSTRDFVAFGKRIVKSKSGKKPTEKDIQKRFEKRQGPSPTVVQSRIGGIGKLQELLGFPYIPGWSEDDFIQYGVRVAKANPEIKLTNYVFDELCRRRRGPSTRTIFNHFGKLSKYQEIIKQEYIFQTEEEKEQQQEKLTDRFRLAEEGMLPRELFNDFATGDDRTLLAQTATFILVDKIFGENMTSTQKLEIVKHKPKSLITAIRNIDSTISAGSIEIIADNLRIFEDIWPMDDYLRHLKVDATK